VSGYGESERRVCEAGGDHHILKPTYPAEPERLQAEFARRCRPPTENPTVV
jgi:hypothetical protein